MTPNLEESNKRLEEISKEINQIVEDANSQSPDLTILLSTPAQTDSATVSLNPITNDHVLTVPNPVRLSLGFSMKSKA